MKECEERNTFVSTPAATKKDKTDSNGRQEQEQKMSKWQNIQTWRNLSPRPPKNLN